MSGNRRTENFHSIKTRQLYFQNTDGSYPPVNSVLTIVNDRGLIVPKIALDISTNTISANALDVKDISAGTLVITDIWANRIRVNDLSAGTIRVNDLSATTIRVNDLSAGTLKVNDLSAGTIRVNDLSASTIRVNDLSAGTLKVNVFSTNTLGVNDLSANTLGVNDLSANTIRVNDLSATTIRVNVFSTNTLGVNDLSANTIRVNDLSANTIRVNDLSANTIRVNDLSAGTLKVNVFSTNTLGVNDLSATTIRVNDLSATTIRVNDLSANTTRVNDLSAGTIRVNDLSANTIRVNDLSATTINVGNGALTIDSSGSLVATNANMTVTGDQNLTGSLQADYITLPDPANNKEETYLWVNSDQLLWQHPDISRNLNISQAVLNQAVDTSITFTTPLLTLPDVSVALTHLLTLFSNRGIFVKFNAPSTISIHFEQACSIQFNAYDSNGLLVGARTYSQLTGNIALDTLCSNITGALDIYGSMNYSSGQLTSTLLPPSTYSISVADINYLGEAFRFVNHLGFVPSGTGGGQKIVPGTKYSLSVTGFSFLSNPTNSDVALVSPGLAITNTKAGSVTISITPPPTGGLTPPNALTYYGIYLNGTDLSHGVVLLDSSVSSYRFDISASSAPVTQTVNVYALDWYNQSNVATSIAITPNPIPAARYAASMAYNGSRIILFGGSYGQSSLLNDTWSYTDASGWLQLAPATSPPRDAGAAMAYNGSRLILFSGQNGFVNTWAYTDASGWVSLTYATEPSPRFATAMAYNGTHIILFSGNSFSSSSAPNDTWSYTDASGWVQLSPTISPLGRIGATMAYDGSKLILFGGQTSASTIVNETWSYTDAIGWAQLSPATSPHARSNAAMAYDGSNVILFGGTDVNGNLLNDTWSWDGSTWTQLSPTISPPPIQNASMAYDGPNTLILFGGLTTAPINPYTNNTWRFSAGQWTYLDFV